MHILKHFDPHDMNPHWSSVAHMVVDLVVSNLTATELENIVRNTFKVHHPESLIHWHPVLDKITHPVHHKGGQSNKTY
jgi:hypothetical protein